MEHNAECMECFENVPYSLDALRGIIKDHSAVIFRWHDGELLVDVTTANLLVKVHDALGEENRRKHQQMMEKSAASFEKAVKVCWKSINRSK